MKEEKVGKKPKGAVLVISIGKPSDKKPERAADPDMKEKMNPYAGFHVEPPASSSPADVEAFRERTLQKLKEMKEQGLIHPTESNPAGFPPPTLAQEPGTTLIPAFISKATPAELMEEAERMRGAGEKGSARRFSDVASQMERGPALAESTINRLGMQAAQALDPDEEDQEAFARFLYGEGKRGADYQDMKLNPNFYPPEQRRQVMKLISQMARQKARAEAMEAEGQAQLDALREEDPTQFFADQDTMQRAFDTLEALDALQKGEPVDFCSCCSPAEIAWAVVKAKKKSKPFHGYNPKRHHKKGGLNAKGRAKFKRETGANLKPPVTTKPSKLKPGSKKAKRRKSFCARMGGMKGPTSKKGKLTPKGAALKRWNC